MEKRMRGRFFLIVMSAFVSAAVGLYFYVHAGDGRQVNHGAQKNISFDQISLSQQDTQKVFESLKLFLGEADVQHIEGLKRMTGGLSGATVFEFKVKNSHFVARFFQHGFDQQVLRFEVQAHEKAAACGVAPRLVWCDYDNGLVVMDFLQGTPLSKDLYNDERLQQCLQILSKLHTTSISSKDAQYFFHEKNRISSDASRFLWFCAQKYPDSILIKNLQEYAEQLSAVANSAPHEKVLVHNDIHCGNIFFNVVDQSIKVIDWADAGYDNRFNDCVIIAYEFIPHFTTTEQFFVYYFSPDYHEKVLTYYLNRAPSERERAWFRLLTRLYRLEVLSKIILDSHSEIASESQEFQRAFQQCFLGYLTTETVNLELAYASGLKVMGYKEWIEDIKRYLTGDFLTDTKLLCNH